MSAMVVELPVADAPLPAPPAKPSRKRAPRKAAASPAQDVLPAPADPLLTELLAAHTVHAAPPVPEPAAAEPDALPASAAPLVPVALAASSFPAWAERPGRAAMDELCEFIVGHGTGGHLAAFARARGFAYMALLDWIQADPARAALYERAREERADILADEVTEIADAPADTAVEVARSRLRVEARKWAAARLKPRAYGERAGERLAGSGGSGVGDVPPAQVHELSDEALLAIARRAAVDGAQGAAGGAGKNGKGRDA